MADFTREECEQWLQNPRKNPRTGRPIDPSATSRTSVYQKLAEQCARLYGLRVGESPKETGLRKAEPARPPLAASGSQRVQPREPAGHEEAQRAAPATGKTSASSLRGLRIKRPAKVTVPSFSRLFGSSLQVVHEPCLKQPPGTASCFYYAPLALARQLLGLEAPAPLACPRGGGHWSDVTAALTELTGGDLGRPVYYLQHSHYGAVPVEFRGAPFEYGRYPETELSGAATASQPLREAVKKVAADGTGSVAIVFKIENVEEGGAHYVACVLEARGAELVLRVCDTANNPRVAEVTHHLVASLKTLDPSTV